MKFILNKAETFTLVPENYLSKLVKSFNYKDPKLVRILKSWNLSRKLPKSLLNELAKQFDTDRLSK